MKVAGLVASAVANRDGTVLLESAEACAELMRVFLSLEWYFNKPGFDSIHGEFQEAKRAKDAKMTEIETHCRGTGLHRTVTLGHLPEVRRAEQSLLTYQLKAARLGVGKLDTLFAHCRGSGTCATLPGLAELRTLSKKGLACTILALLEMILDQHIAKARMHTRERARRAYVWLKSKTVCGVRGSMFVDHIFSTSCSCSFATLVQQCLAEWPEVPETGWLKWFYEQMYGDVELDRLARVKQKARELAVLTNPWKWYETECYTTYYHPIVCNLWFETPIALSGKSYKNKIYPCPIT